MYISVYACVYCLLRKQELMRYFFSVDDVEPDTEDTPTMAAFRALGLEPDREPDALKVRFELAVFFVLNIAGRQVPLLRSNFLHLCIYIICHTPVHAAFFCVSHSMHA